jgi:hypothetical protein
MVYYTIYLKNLHNSTGYVDICLESDELLKDYLQYLDIRVKTHKSYRIINFGDSRPEQGRFAINLDDIAAITVAPPPQT